MAEVKKPSPPVNVPEKKGVVHILVSGPINVKSNDSKVVIERKE